MAGKLFEAVPGDKHAKLKFLMRDALKRLFPGSNSAGGLRFLVACLMVMVTGLGRWAVAGPPFLTDDPEPVAYKHWELYAFSVFDKARDGTLLQTPAFEVNYGFAPDFQAHLVLPFATSFPTGGDSTFGLGDAELGVKYRFTQETESRPMVGIFPMLEIDTGDADRGLGNGRTWVKLPVWTQKSWGPWTTYGGGGLALNSASGRRNYPFGGWLVQRSLGDKLTLGGEIFAQGKTTDDGRATAIANVGGYYNFSKDFSLLVTVGHSIAGEEHFAGYVGLYWTW